MAAGGQGCQGLRCNGDRDECVRQGGSQYETKVLIHG